MSKGLVIVESPAKAKTIQKYLGKGFTVEASLGHVKDLPKSTLGVDIDNDFETEYVVIPGKEKVVAKLKKLAHWRTPSIWRLTRTAKAKPSPRIWPKNSAATERKSKKKKKKDDENGTSASAASPSTKSRSAPCARPSSIPATSISNLVDAQQARRVLDRLVGYQVSPLLWDKVRRGLSAGRVQTVALRLIVEREREIKAFEKKEYWTIDAHLAGPKPPAFDARFLGKGEEKVEVPNAEEAEKIRAALENADWVVRSGREERAPPQCDSAVHHQQAATGFFAQAALQREAHHDDRAAPV